MKKLMSVLIIMAFAGSLIAQNANQQNAPGNTAPRVSQDNGKDKDDGKHIGEDKEHHRHHHHRHHHEHRGDAKK